MDAAPETTRTPSPASDPDLPPHIVAIAAAGDALNATIPSHARSMERQTVASFARTTPVQVDGAEAVTPVIDDDESQNGPKVKKPKRVMKSASQSSVAGEGEKAARKGSYNYVAECLTKAMAKVDKLTTGMTMRINSVTSTAESSAHEIGTLRDKVARLEKSIDDLRAERADGYDTGTESDSAATGGRKRKAGSNAGSRTSKCARYASCGRASHQSSRDASRDRWSPSRSSRSRSPQQREGSEEEKEKEGRSTGEETEEEGYEYEGSASGGGRPLLERLEAEKKTAKWSLAERLGFQDVADNPDQPSTHRGQDRSASPQAPGSSKGAVKERARSQPRSAPGPPRRRGDDMQGGGAPGATWGEPSLPRGPKNWEAPYAGPSGGPNRGFNRGRGGRGGQHSGPRGGYRGGFNGAPRMQGSYQSHAGPSAPHPPPPPPFRAPDAPHFPSLRPEVRIGQGTWTDRHTFEDICAYIAEIKAKGFGPVPRPKKVGEPEGENAKYVVATFFNRHDAGVFKQCWNWWCSSNVLYSEDSNAPSFNGRKISVRCWNVNGRLAANLSHPDFFSKVSDYDVNFFQETHLYPSQELTLPVPSGYDVFAVARTPSLTFGKQWGGVVAMVRTDLELSVDEILSGPDLLVLKAGAATIFSAYVLPHGSPWEEWASVAPLEKLAQSIAIAKIRGDAVIVVGDLNGRTADRRVDSGSHPSRLSADATVNTQGRALLQIGRDYGLRILNGDLRFGGNSWDWTFAQKRNGRWCRSVIDYALGDLAGCAMVKNLQVGLMGLWSDHAPLVLRLEVPDVPVPTNPGLPYLREKLRKAEDSQEPLDSLLRETLACKRSPEE
ncbi:hypothetical protein B0H16DRAFT_1454701 [Mycena metata]|uniref:Endonuclease/exonuclease/phosphatase domain-containing protein n=1 Tax=Mycena metata TaxID=1033252 RepID=A0AAD7JHD4_9AGAR|nr:hypothetical protein B0H16DRAFT_1454701 [Mycena metata]